MKQAWPDFNLFYDNTNEAEKIEAYARAGALGMLKARVIYDSGIIIKAGSRFEMNGDLYTLEEDNSFSLPSGDEWDRYIYFDSTSFSIVSTAPTFKAGGWYNGSNRALIKVRAELGCIFWTLLDRQFPKGVKVKNATVTTIFEQAVAGNYAVTIPVNGKYRITLKGGGGGGGGSGGSGISGSPGGPSTPPVLGGTGGRGGFGGVGGNKGGASGVPEEGGSPAGIMGGIGGAGAGGGEGKVFTAEVEFLKGAVLFLRVGAGGAKGSKGSTGGGSGGSGGHGEDSLVQGSWSGTATGGSAGSGTSGGGSGAGKGGNGGASGSDGAAGVDGSIKIEIIE